jgi:hypothetical protein
MIKPSFHVERQAMVLVGSLDGMDESYPALRIHTSIEAIEASVDDHEAAIRRIIEIVQATPYPTASGRRRREGDPEVRKRVGQALTSYRGAVTEMVLSGSISIDQGSDLSKMVDAIEAEEKPA